MSILSKIGGAAKSAARSVKKTVKKIDKKTDFSKNIKSAAKKTASAAKTVNKKTGFTDNWKGAAKKTASAAKTVNEKTGFTDNWSKLNEKTGFTKNIKKIGKIRDSHLDKVEAVGKKIDKAIDKKIGDVAGVGSLYRLVKDNVRLAYHSGIKGGEGIYDSNADILNNPWAKKIGKFLVDKFVISGAGDVVDDVIDIYRDKDGGSISDRFKTFGKEVQTSGASMVTNIISDKAGDVAGDMLKKKDVLDAASQAFQGVKEIIPDKLPESLSEIKEIIPEIPDITGSKEYLKAMEKIKELENKLNVNAENIFPVSIIPEIIFAETFNFIPWV